MIFFQEIIRQNDSNILYEYRPKRTDDAVSGFNEPITDNCHVTGRRGNYSSICEYINESKMHEFYTSAFQRWIDYLGCLHVD